MSATRVQPITHPSPFIYPLSPQTTDITAHQFLAKAIHKLEQAGIDSPAHEAKTLLCRLMGWPRWMLGQSGHNTLSPQQYQRLVAGLEQRCRHVPLATILGEKEFYSLTFKLNASCLVPRPESEHLVSQCLEVAHTWQPDSDNQTLRLLDLGCGSGCLIITCLVHLPQAKGWALDYEHECVAMTRCNAQHHHVASRLTTWCGDWLEGMRTDQRFDIILANPPYIPSCDIHNELRAEARLALDGGADGCDPYRRIASRLKHHLNPNGTCLLEIDLRNYARIAEIFPPHRWKHRQRALQNNIAVLGLSPSDKSL